MLFFSSPWSCSSFVLLGQPLLWETWNENISASDSQGLYYKSTNQIGPNCRLLSYILECAQNEARVKKLTLTEHK